MINTGANNILNACKKATVASLMTPNARDGSTKLGRVRPSPERLVLYLGDKLADPQALGMVHFQQGRCRPSFGSNADYFQYVETKMLEPHVSPWVK